jgi:hypothetical protein
MMEHNLQHTISLLTRTPATLDALLRDLPETWTFRNEGENTWSAFDIVGHLIHGERTDWMPRARMALQFGETKAFEPFDRLGHIRETQNKSLGQLLDEFARLRSENLGELHALNLRPEDLERRGRHPALGVVTLSELLAAWACCSAPATARLNELSKGTASDRSSIHKHAFGRPIPICGFCTPFVSQVIVRDRKGGTASCTLRPCRRAVFR